MNDRLPGTTYSNPIWHRGWRIYLNPDCDWPGFEWSYVHDNYDGAEDAHDNRHGHAASEKAAKEAIDEKEDD